MKEQKLINVNVGERLRYQRLRAHFTVEELAEGAGVTPRFICDIERGNVGISMTTLQNICKTLKISADSLVFGESAGLDAKLRGLNRETVEAIEDMTDLQLKFINKQSF